MLKVWIFICAALSMGVLSFPRAEEKTIGHTDYCEDWGIKLEKDKEVFVPGECIKATCVLPEINEIVYTKCAQLDLRPGCHLTEADHSKSYPDCCPKRVCKDESGNV